VKSNIEFLSKMITPNCSGIIWLTDKELDFEMSGVYEFNYLLNGLLTKSIANEEETNEKGHLFLAENFGRPFFISHNVISDKNDLANVQKHLEVASPLFSETAEVFVFNKSNKASNKNIVKDLSKKFKNIQFENLEINSLGDKDENA
jgi:hypothetical protein